MAKTIIAILAILYLAVVGRTHDFEAWSQGLRLTGIKSEQVTDLHFYFHDTVSGTDPTAVRVAQATGTDRSPTLFGMVMMADDPLTEGPDPTSNVVGRAQGIYGSAGQNEVGLIMSMSFAFTNGSTTGAR
uniref:Dirigent protein n=1 Tax=Ananas comosus var. bracteatus TaxID=296719 RepID=A0A6V7NS54_ANACO|nr:unnamed protein product [Ananas comosus var. bracteatus]